MKRKLFRNRKAVSTVVGTILMILVVMAGMSILFGVLIVYAENFQSGRGSSVLESITVEDVYFINQNTIKLTIFNTGKVDLIISNVYIDGQMATVNPVKLSIIEGHHEELTVTPTIAFSIGSSYDFKIVTQRGTGFEGTYIW